MPIYYADRVQETTTTTGTGTVTLGGGVSRSQTFNSGIGTGKQTYYSIYYPGAALAAGFVAGNGTTNQTTYSTDTTAAATAANLTVDRFSLSGVSDGAVSGYACGGRSSTPALVTTDRITYSTATTAAATAANLTAARCATVGVSGYRAGYVGGGNSDSTVATDFSNTDKVVFSTGTTAASSTANLSRVLNSAGGISDGVSRGYSAGGIQVSGGSYLTQVDRISFSSDLTVALTATALTAGRSTATGCPGEGVKGYWVGGIESGAAVVATADRLVYSTEAATAVTTADLSSQRYGAAGLTDGTTKGYACGGNTGGGNVTTSDKIDYSTDATTTQTTAALTTSRSGTAGLGMIGPVSPMWEIGAGTVATSTTLSRDAVLVSSTGGSLVNLPAGTKTVAQVLPGAALDRFSLTKEVVLTAGGTIAANDAVYVSTSDGKVYQTDADAVTTSLTSWFLGFATEAGSANNPVTVRTAGRLTGFSGLTANATQYLSGTAGAITSSRPTNAVVVGVALSATEILINNNYPAEFRVTAGSAGYAPSGNTSAGDVTAIDRLIFATETTAAVTASAISLAREGVACVSDSVGKGFVVGGITSAVQSVADRLSFATEVVSASTGANLTQARQGAAGVSERSTKGYFAGGETGAVVTTADKIVFVTETTAASTASNLTQQRSYLAGMTQGSTKGYLLGGRSGTAANTNVATGNLLTFSTDATTAVTTANLSQARWGVGGFSDGSTKGFVGGGQSSNTAIVATGTKMTFSTDTQASITTANMSAVRRLYGAMASGSTNGYYQGGASTNGTTRTTTGNRTVFSTETNAALTTTNLTTAKYIFSSVSDIGL